MHVVCHSIGFQGQGIHFCTQKYHFAYVLYCTPLFSEVQFFFVYCTVLYGRVQFHSYLGLISACFLSVLVFLNPKLFPVTKINTFMLYFIELNCALLYSTVMSILDLISACDMSIHRFLGSKNSFLYSKLL